MKSKTIKEVIRVENALEKTKAKLERIIDEVDDAKAREYLTEAHDKVVEAWATLVTLVTEEKAK